jgi:hypothetical protein
VKRQLFRGYGATRVLVSSDEQWIVLEIRESHDFGTFETYRYLGDLKFEVYDTEVERRVLATLMKSRDLTEPPEFSRFFCRPYLWSSHSNSLLGYLETQHMAGRPPSRFYFVYGLENRKVTLDLSVFNNPAPSRQRDAASR